MTAIDRRGRMLGACDIAKSRGLEIGALTSPLVRRSEGDIRYVDYATTEFLRAKQHHESVVVENIVDVDIVWGDRPLAEAIDAPVDYILASHVIEHVPDLIGWLNELHAALKPGGTLGLAIPDRRFTFDIRRNESQLSEMVEAYLLRYRKPSIRQVFDVCALSTEVDATEAWRRELRDGAVAPALLSKLPEAFDVARGMIENPSYIDAHCWVFTPESFLDVAQWLSTLRLFPYAIEAFYPTEPNGLEFFVRLAAVHVGSDALIAEKLAAARRVVAEAPSEAAYRAAMMPDVAKIAATPWNDPARPDPRVQALEAEVAELRRVVQVLHRSTSWRMTAPLRALATRMQVRRTIPDTPRVLAPVRRETSTRGSGRETVSGTVPLRNDDAPASSAGRVAANANSAPVAVSPGASVPEVPRFVDWFPRVENTGPAFAGEWSCAVPGLPGTGALPLFQDGRIDWFGERLGGFAGKRVLELGPLEGAHTWMMTSAGASVLAIESNVRAWLRCLAVKEALGMPGSHILLGDFVAYLGSNPPRVDFALASGVLYHMTDPVKLLRDLASVSDTIGLWTHYFDPEIMRTRGVEKKFDFTPRKMVTPRGRAVELYDQRYLEALHWSGFCGGSASGSCWLRRDDILGVLEDEGFECEIAHHEPDHQNGPAFSLFAQRTRI